MTQFRMLNEQQQHLILVFCTRMAKTVYLIIEIFYHVQVNMLNQLCVRIYLSNFRRLFVDSCFFCINRISVNHSIFVSFSFIAPYRTL